MLQISILDISFKIINLRLQPQLRGAKELIMWPKFTALEQQTHKQKEGKTNKMINKKAGFLQQKIYYNFII